MDGLDPMFRALGNSIRRAILLRLALGETTVNALCESFDISAPAISNHVQTLEKVSLQTRRQQGNSIFCDLRLRRSATPRRGSTSSGGHSPWDLFFCLEHRAQPRVQWGGGKAWCRLQGSQRAAAVSAQGQGRAA